MHIVANGKNEEISEEISVTKLLEELNVESLPNEACGLLDGELDGDDKIVRAVYPLANIDKSSEHFSMAPTDQFTVIKDLRQSGFVLLGNFHSHPATPARPSEEDLRLSFDPRLSYLIVSLAGDAPVIKSFRVKDKTSATEEPIVTLQQPGKA
ncbi:Mov34/MPN/PAD-1 family protein [Spirochaetia bacterium]|nr:Mov34/MPN/PAD-1 family protein [Spirochaetia bacterium]